MRPLIIILICSLIAGVYGRPGQLPYSYPAPTPSAAPAFLSNLPAPTPSIAPSLLIDNGANNAQLPALQFLRIGGQPQGLTQFALPLAAQGLTFAQPGFNFGGQLLNIGTPQVAFNAGHADGVNSAQVNLAPAPQVNFASVAPTPQINLGRVEPAPQVNFASVTPTPQIHLASYEPVHQVNFASVTPTPQINLASIEPAPQVNIASVTPTPQVNIVPVGPTRSNIDLGVASDSTVVHKHVYVHVAPEEPEEIRSRPIAVAAPQKHYKIIFIKAPSPPIPAAPVIPAQPQDLEKTIVYVLVKRPDEQPEIRLQTPPPTQPSKPEVYFIRYKAHKDSSAAVTAPVTAGIQVENANGGLPVVEDLLKTNSVAPTVSNAGLNNIDVRSGIPLNLNKASLDGGSALSVALKHSGDAVQLSGTPVSRYGPPGYDHK